MEAILVVVGFLGAGKTTLLRNLAASCIEANWNPFIILNDYESAHMDAQQFVEQIGKKQVKALSGSCICCSGIHELRNLVNCIPERKRGITLIEANGTSDACSLMGFLGVGLDDRFLPPVQISVVDVKNWQTRGENNELEASQIQVSSLIVLTHIAESTEKRRASVISELKALNPFAKIMTTSELDITLLSELSPSENNTQKLDHKKAHWSSCSTDLPNLPESSCIQHLCDALPKSILRVKGCTKIKDEEEYTYFERSPDGQVSIRPYKGIPITGAKLLTVGPGSEPRLLKEAIAKSLDIPKIT